MLMLKSLTSVIFNDLWTAVISLLIGYVVYKLSGFYYRVYSFPPGPLPLPLVGNLLRLRSKKKHMTTVMEEIAKKYGKVTTIWMGNKPLVMINDIDIGREAFRKNDMAGRPVNELFGDVFSNDKRTDIVLADYGHRWEALRRVTHSAVQKYSVTDNLSVLAMDCVDNTMDAMFEREGLDKPFVPFDYIYNMFLNILAASAFGRRYDMDDPEYKLIKYIQKDMVKEIGMRAVFWMAIPSLRHIDPKYYKIWNGFNDLMNLIGQKYQAHYKDYDEASIRDFCDTLITAKNEAIKDNKESAPYLTDDNLAMAIFDLFFAGTDTSQTTFRWMLFYMLYFRDTEKKLREEVENLVGDRMPTHEDRNRCHYCMAFISEALRHNNIVSIGVQHKAVVDTKLGEFTIPKDTQVSVYQGYILRSQEYWDKPEEFRPERFLDSDGKYLTTRPKAFIPFGVGRRVCLGEKLAIADLFLVLVRFLQKTTDYEIQFYMKETKDPLNPDPSVPELHPQTFEISLHKK